MSRVVSVVCFGVAFALAALWAMAGLVLGGNGLVAIPPLAAALALLTLLLRRDAVAVISIGFGTGTLLVLAIITGFSIGLFLLPAVFFGVVAIVAAGWDLHVRSQPARQRGAARPG